MVKNIFIAGLDEFHHSQLRSLKKADQYSFKSLISYEEIKCGETFPVQEFVENSIRMLQLFKEPVDAVVGFWDFPVSTVLPYIREQVGLSGPSLQSVLKCEHKYWSRLEQSEVLPEMIPQFIKVNPFDDSAAGKCDLPYPFWLKPVKSVLSHLGFLIRDRIEFDYCLSVIRGNISRYAEPFNYILSLADLPAEIEKVDGYQCIAEGLISSGEQCTLEGYVLKGEVCIYGVVDSIRSGMHHSSFARYQYPSFLPLEAQKRMIAATEKIMLHIGYDNAPFNIEFYWNKETDEISLLEINTRISKSHCPLFKMVDGEYHHSVMIEVALGNSPDFAIGKGPAKVAAKFMLRHYRDGLVSRVPNASEIKALKDQFPGTEVILHVSSGMNLSELRDQDSYSFEICDLFMGAENHSQLLENYQTALSMLPFTIKEREEAA